MRFDRRISGRIKDILAKIRDSVEKVGQRAAFYTAAFCCGIERQLPTHHKITITELRCAQPLQLFLYNGLELRQFTRLHPILWAEQDTMEIFLGAKQFPRRSIGDLIEVVIILGVERVDCVITQRHLLSLSE